MSPAAGAPASILLVDDDRAMGLTLQKILQKAGYDAALAPNGADALKASREAAAAGKQVLALLLDIRLPDMSGLDVLREVKKNYPDISAIMMTGYADTETAVGALNDGAFAYIVKPYNIDEVKAILSRAVERQRLIQENRRLLVELQEANAALEAKVQERTKQLQSANLRLADTIEQLQQAAAAKAEFVSMLTHELRTPLEVIAAHSGFLAEGDEHDAEQRKRSLRAILETSRGMGRLVTDILNLSQAQTTRALSLDLTRFNLKELVGRVVSGIKALNTGLSYEIVVEDGAEEIVSDKDRVEQVLVNLIGNASKYTFPGTLVKVVIKRAPAEVSVGVIDAGPGLREDERTKVFAAFYRTEDAVGSKKPGTGLGLTITKLIVETLGGRIWVEPGEGGRGCRFIFTIPIEAKTGLSA